MSRSLFVFLFALSFASLSSSSLASAQAEPDAPSGEAEEPLALIVTGGADIGYFQDGGGLYGPFGLLRAFIGYDIAVDGGAEYSLGYSGAFGYGVDSATARNPTEVFITRQGVGLAIHNQAEWLAFFASTGVVLLHSFESDASLAGWTLDGGLGFRMGPIWIDLPMGIDYFPSVSAVASRVGLDVGVAIF